MNHIGTLNFSITKKIEVGIRLDLEIQLREFRTRVLEVLFPKINNYVMKINVIEPFTTSFILAQETHLVTKANFVLSAKTNWNWNRPPPSRSYMSPSAAVLLLEKFFLQPPTTTTKYPMPTPILYNLPRPLSHC